MITEDYCSFEVAKLLKEKGFDECTRAVYYFSDKSIHYCTNSSNYNNGLYVAIMAAATQQMVMAWLRKMHHLHIGINPVSGKGYNATIYDVADFDDYGIISDTEFFFHPEEAIEVAIKYCLENLI